MSLTDIIALARSHASGMDIPPKPLACQAVDIAVQLMKAGDFHRARVWALDSLRYSVGMGHPDYQRAAR